MYPTGRTDHSDLPRSQGHTNWSRHIEEPRKRFTVEVDSTGYFNVLFFADTRRRAYVLAETPEGALAIGRCHLGFRGSNFTLTDSARQTTSSLSRKDMAMNESASPRKHSLRSCAVARYERHHFLVAIGHGAPRRYFAGLSVYFTERDTAALSSRLLRRTRPKPDTRTALAQPSQFPSAPPRRNAAARRSPHQSPWAPPRPEAPPSPPPPR